MVIREDNIYFRIGIYGIRNLVNGKIYVGKTGMNFGDRWDSHRSFSSVRCHRTRERRCPWEHRSYGR